MPGATPRTSAERPRISPARFAETAARLGTELRPLPPLDRTSTCAEAVSAALTRDARRLLDNIGPLPAAADVEVLHQARVALRRLRTDLRTLRPLLDPDDTSALDPELAWLGRSIGTVRDHDVFCDILTSYARELPDEPAVARLAEHLAVDRTALLADLSVELLSERAVAALTAVTTLAVDPPMVALVDEPAATLLTELVRRPWRKLARRARELDQSSSVGELHDLRIRVKKTRYAAEAALPVRADAATHVRTLARLQTTLGDIHDATLAIERLHDLVAGGLDGDLAYAAGIVTTLEHGRIERRRAEWPQRWEQTRRKRARAWLDTPV